MVVLDGRALHLLKALNDTLRPPLANLEFGVHWTSLQVNWGASSDWHTDQVVGRLATTVLGELDGSGSIEVREAAAIGGSRDPWPSATQHRPVRTTEFCRS